jgi:hypothetical protein
MKHVVALFFALQFCTFLVSAGWLDALGLVKKAVATNELTGASAANLSSLSQDQVIQGLKEALGKGVQQAITNLGHDGGFLTNLNVKIPMPEKLQTVERTLRALKQDQMADQFVTTMNHAAEQAVPEAASVFVDAIKGMTIEDAKSILAGATNAATVYFRKATEAKLQEKFLPIVKTATDKVGVTAAYKQLMAKATPAADSLGGFGSSLLKAVNTDTVDVDSYVTSKALDGLFVMVAAEEQRIRQNPIARTTDILKQVFGAVTAK